MFWTHTPAANTTVANTADMMSVGASPLRNYWARMDPTQPCPTSTGDPCQSDPSQPSATDWRSTYVESLMTSEEHDHG